MEIPDKSIKKIKDALEKESGKEISWEDAKEGVNNLVGLVDILYKLYIKDEQRKRKLKQSPKGFALEGGGYSCAICGDLVLNGQAWYDKWGIKCPLCQKAIEKRIIPGSMARNNDRWYSKYDLESCFGINHHAMKRLIKEGVLKTRIVPTATGRPHVYLFLIKDNKNTLPPKKLTKTEYVREVHEDGTEWFRCEPWYKFVDPFECLKGYRIVDYLKLIDEKG